MTALVLLVVVASWCLVSAVLGLSVCRAIVWARGQDPADETTPAQPSPEPRPAITLPTPRSHDAVVDLTAVGEPAGEASGEPPRRAVGA